MKKYMGREIFSENEEGTAFVVYSKFALGKKYTVYTKRDGIVRYACSFDSPYDACEYMLMIYRRYKQEKT